MDNNTGSLAPLLTKEEAAAYLKVSHKTIERRVASGELKCIKLGKSVRFNLNDLQQTSSSQVQTA